jgi:PAS domain-containing protein
VARRVPQPPERRFPLQGTRIDLASDRGKRAHHALHGIKKDITSFMEADAACPRIAGCFTAVFAALLLAFVVIDAQQKILMANPAAEALLVTPLARGSPLAELNLRWLDQHVSRLRWRIIRCSRF